MKGAISWLLLLSPFLWVKVQPASYHDGENLILARASVNTQHPRHQPLSGHGARWLWNAVHGRST